ncbi:MAG: acyl carrier protein [Clostridia bacterium]|nr:acyl carrier protein [Clostridia bacterium]
MFEEFKNLLVEQMNIDEADITPEAELIADLGINSLELADLIFSCEAKYNIEIDEDDYRKFVTVGDVIAYLEETQA